MLATKRCIIDYIEYKDGTKEWFLNGERHRTDGPAIEWSNGTKEWWLNGYLHRTDGPAIEYSNGTKEWWLNGKKLTQEEFDNYRFKEFVLNGKNLFC
jgi:hypothetical protein